jgi:ABC-type transporter Mla subunit MlaD
MQEKEMMTQPRTDTSELIFKCKAVAAAVSSCELEELLDEVVDTLTQQEATIKALRAELVELSAKAMSEEDVIRHLRAELCNASAVAMGHAETVKTFREELDLLNKRPKR